MSAGTRTSGLAADEYLELVNGALHVGRHAKAFFESELLHYQALRRSVVLEVDRTDEIVSGQDWKRVVATLALGQRLVDLDPVVEVEKRAIPHAVSNEIVERREQHRPAAPRRGGVVRVVAVKEEAALSF